MGTSPNPSTTPSSPTSDAAVDVDRANEISAVNAAEQAAALGQTVPLASEPLQPTEVEVVKQTLQQAMSALSNGQLNTQLAPLDDIEIPGPLEQLPEPIWILASTLFSFLRQGAEEGVSEAEAYADIDLVELASSNAGLQELAAVLTDMTSDTPLIQAINNGTAGAAPDEPPPEAENTGHTSDSQATELLA